MANPTRSELIRSTSRGLPWEKALADEGLHSITLVNRSLIPNHFQLAPYTASLLHTMRKAGLPITADPEVEPGAREVRGLAIAGADEVQQTYIMPKQTLRMVVGSAAITAGTVAHLREAVAASDDNKIFAFYEDHSTRPQFDAVTDPLFGDFRVLDSSNPDYGRTLWVVDSELSVDPGTTAYARLPQLAHLMLQHELTVTGPDALPLIDNALDYLHGQSA